ncbi:hypothetical protein [Kribbella swartbergensis]
MVRRTLALFVTVLAVAALGAAPAQAGGPTSVLLSSPPKVVAVGYEDQRYADLQRLTDSVGSRDAAGDERHAVGNFVRAAWLIHDMSVWRLDIIYPDAPGGPWIARQEYNGGPSSGKPTWHTPADKVGLLKLLGSLQLLSGQRNGEPSYGGPTSFHHPADAAPASEPPAAESPAETAPAKVESTSVFTGWRWTIPGFLLGAVLAVVAVRLLPRRRDWQLIDAE